MRWPPQRSDALQFAGQRLDASALGSRLIHAAGVEIADFLRIAAGGGARVGRCGLQQLVDIVLVVLIQDLELTPARIGGRNRVVAQEAAIGVTEKILEWISALVQPFGMQGVRGGAHRRQQRDQRQHGDSFHLEPRIAARLPAGIIAVRSIEEEIGGQVARARHYGIAIQIRWWRVRYGSVSTRPHQPGFQACGTC